MTITPTQLLTLLDIAERLDYERLASDELDGLLADTATALRLVIDRALEEEVA